MSTLFYIIALAINLTSNYSGKFILTVNADKFKYECHISHMEKSIWKASLIGAPEKIQNDTLSYNFEIKGDSVIIFPLDKYSKKIEGKTKKPVCTALSLNDFFETHNIDWKNVNKIQFKFKDSTRKKEAISPLDIKREKNRILLTQEHGFFKEIIIKW